MPWMPELFSAPVLQHILDERRRDALVAVPYFDGLLAGDLEALVESFAGQPELHDPLRGRIRGVAAFRTFATDLNAWLHERHAWVEDVQHVVLAQRGFEEVILHLGDDQDAIHLPVAVLADRTVEGRIEELRIYFSTRPLTGRSGHRPPLLQPDPELRLPDDVAAYVAACADGEVDAIAATFEREGMVRDWSDGQHRHTGHAGLHGFYEGLFADGGVRMETCAVVDDGQRCSLEYNTGEGQETTLLPQAGIAVFVRGATGAFSQVHGYDDVGTT
jgi:SnoaL-like domain